MIVSIFLQSLAVIISFFVFVSLLSIFYVTLFPPVFVFAPNRTLPTPEGRPGMSGVCLLSKISELSFESTLLSPFLFFCPLPLLFLSCLFFFCLLAHFVKRWALWYGQEMIVGRWYVQHAAIWHWYLPLCVYVLLKMPSHNNI